MFQSSAPCRPPSAMQLHVCAHMCGAVPNHAFMVNVRRRLNQECKLTASQTAAHVKTAAMRCLTSNGPRLKRKNNKKNTCSVRFLLPPMLLAIKRRQRPLLGFCASELLAFKCSWIRRLTAPPQHHSYPRLQTPPSPTATDRTHQSGGKSYAVQSVFPTTAFKKKNPPLFFIQACVSMSSLVA